MIKIEEIQFDSEMILSGGKFVLVELLPRYDKEVVGNEQKRAGTEVIVALTNHRLEKISVMVSDNIACGPLNELELAQVTFENFVGNFNYDKTIGEYVFTATASKLLIVR